MTHEQRANKFVTRLLHDAHLRYQRQQLAPSDDSKMACNPNATPSPEVRGVRRKASLQERKARQFKPEWFTHLRPNFYKAYFETLIYMAQ